MKAHILIVDDNVINLKLTSAILECGGFTVAVASDAEHAQVVLTKMVPDLILMDIALPGMDGLSLTRIIKADSRLSHVPVVALTAFAMKGDDHRAFEAGCDAHIAKPIDTRNFTAQVQSVLNSSRMKQPEKT